MPHSLAAYAATNAYRAQLLALTDRTVQQAARNWQTVDRDNLDETFTDWLTTTAALTTGARAAATAITAAHMQRYMAAELDEPDTTVPTPDVDTETASDGRPMTDTLAPALLTVKATLALRQPTQQALNAGLNRASRTVSVQVLSSGRQSMDSLLRNDGRVIGWRRAVTGAGCGACLAAATGAIQENDITLPVHPHCRCVKEAVVAGRSNRYRRPTGQEIFDGMGSAEQDALFAGRGGAAKAQLVRDGDVPLSALLTHEAQVTGPSLITETPLNVLLASAA